MTASTAHRAVLARLRPSAPVLLALAFTALGLLLRVEHAMTFDGVRRGSDYNVHTDGVRWMLEHKRPFYFTPDLSDQVGYQAPLWYAIAAVVLQLTGSERAISGIAVAGWLVRQLVLWLMLAQAAALRPISALGPRREFGGAYGSSDPPLANFRRGTIGWGALAALALHAVLPLSVLTDGKLNPEGLLSTFFMLACYPLWRIECAAAERDRVPLGAALGFGLLAGLALLTKATGIVLWFGAAVMVSWQALRIGRKLGVRAMLRRVALPMLAAGVLFAAVASVWVGPNLRKFGHPFPHAWIGIPQAEPLLYRRPLGWALPFDWGPTLKFPIIRSATDPRPNFWSVVVIGSFSDWYNRGLCRLQGEGRAHKRVWGYYDATWGGRFWGVSKRCVRLHRRVVWAGLVLAVIGVVALFQVAVAQLRSGGRRGSLVLPTLVVTEVAFVMLFALTYPFDWGAVLNPRYLLSAVTPMCACLGIGLMQLRNSRRLGRIVHAVVLVAVTVIAGLVVFERFGA